jgi:hypothetical protein
MATVKNTTVIRKDKPQKKNKGVHAKTKTSKNKKATLYKKRYNGQG